jgi:hypothetical protein
MHLFRKIAAPKLSTLVLGLLTVPLLASPDPALSQARTVNATLDTSRTGAPISKYIYGRFLEHGGDIVNTGIWSEMLVDRKFFYSVAASAPTPPPEIDATVQVDKKPEVQVEEQTLGAFLGTITVRPFSVNIYSYPVQQTDFSREDPDEINEAVLCVRNYIGRRARTVSYGGAGADERSRCRPRRKARCGRAHKNP